MFLLSNHLGLLEKTEAPCNQRLYRFRAELFLSPRLDIALRKLSIVCSLSLGRGRISSRMLDVLSLLPSHKETRGKRLCKCRLRCKRPSLQQRWFRVCPAWLAVLRVPRLCVRCVLQQPVGFSENQGLSAKIFTIHMFVRMGKY